MQSRQDHYKETIETWDSLAEIYAEKFHSLDLYIPSYEKLVSYIQSPNAKVLEVGCGPGIVSSHLLRLRPNLEILATDVSPNMVRVVNQMFPKLKTQVLDVREIGNLNKRFQAVVAAFVIPYLAPSDFEKFVFEARNLLEKNAVVYLSFVPGDPNDSGFLTGSTNQRTYFNFYQESFVSEMLTKNQFKTLDVIHLTYQKESTKAELHTVIIAQNTVD